MGRTNPTYRDRLRSLESRWSDYRHTLRRRDRDPFDRLWEHARAHADAGGFQNPPDPMDAVLLSICLEQERTIGTLQEQVDGLESQVSDESGSGDATEANEVDSDGTSEAEPQATPESEASEPGGSH